MKKYEKNNGVYVGGDGSFEFGVEHKFVDIRDFVSVFEYLRKERENNSGFDYNSFFDFYNGFLDETKGVVFGSNARDKVFSLLDKFSSVEWGVVLVGRKENGVVFVDDVVVLEQSVNGSHIEFLGDSNKVVSSMNNIVGWLHSHNNMSAFYSNTDLITTISFNLGITINNKKECVGYVVKKFGDVYFYYEVDVNFFGYSADVNFLSDAEKKIKVGFGSNVIGMENLRVDNGCIYDEDEGCIDYCSFCGCKINEMNKSVYECSSCGSLSHKKCRKNFGYDNMSGFLLCFNCYLENECYG